MTNLERIRKDLSTERRKKVDTRAVQLLAEELAAQGLGRTGEARNGIAEDYPVRKPTSRASKS